jgi:hypothetical protein
MDLEPNVIIVDRLDLEGDIDPATVAGLRELAAQTGAELWMACRTHREGPKGEPGHLPPPADRFEDSVDLAFRLDPYDAKVRLHVLKDNDQMVGQDLNILLDPQTARTLRPTAASYALALPRTVASPPSTPMTWPVIQSFAGSSNQVMARDTSSGWPMRPSGCIPSEALRIIGFEVMPADIGVSTSPGATTLTRIPLRA